MPNSRLNSFLDGRISPQKDLFLLKCSIKRSAKISMNLKLNELLKKFMGVDAQKHNNTYTHFIKHGSKE